MSERIRISVNYGGIEYSIADRTLDDVMQEIDRANAADRPSWLEVRIGTGRSTVAQLRLGPGIPIAVWLVNSEDPPAPRAHPHNGDDSKAHSQDH